MALLILAIVTGLIAGLARAQWKHRSLRIPAVKQIWLVLAAFVAQAAVFQIPFTRQRIPDPSASAIFIGSQLLLLAFIWNNRRLPGVWILGGGLLLNMIAICLNGGWMPVSTETVNRLFSPSALASIQVGQRLGYSKDQVFYPADIRLGILADRFLLPGWVPYHVAFSIGDGFIAVGAFLLLWSIGAPHPPIAVEQHV